MTATYRALDFTFTVSIADGALSDYLADALGALAVVDRVPADAEVFRVEAAESEDSALRFAVSLDDTVLATRSTASGVVDTIVQRTNLRCAESPGYLSTHASAISRNGDAALFAADSESGKSTLAAGLVRAGLAYVSDEAVAFEWGTGCIHPYPKPISLDPGSWPLFPELDPSARFDDATLAQWQVPATTIGPGRISPVCRARWVVFPKYEADATTQLTPISRGEALVEWSKNTFRFNQLGRDALELLGQLVPEVECYRMAVGDLDHAVACVTDLVGA